MKEKKEEKVRVLFSFGHLFDDNRVEVICKKSEIEYWGNRYLAEERLGSGILRERAPGILFPYFYYEKII